MKRHSISLRRFGGFLRAYPAILGLIIIILIGCIVDFRSFMTLQNFANVGRQTTIRGLLACGMTLVVLTGSLDLSVSFNFAMCSFLSLFFGRYHIVLAFLCPILFGMLVGLVNSFLICKWRFSPWIATISIQLLLKGLLLTIVSGATYAPERNGSLEILYKFGNFQYGYINTYIIVFVAAFVIFSILLEKKAIFRNFYAVGGNAEAAKMMGISVFKTRILAHVLCGVMAALAGILLAARTGCAYPDAGTGYEMYAIAASVVGGIYLKGGRGKIIGTFFGAWIFGFMNNIFNMQTAIDPLWEQIITGTIIIVVVLAQSVNGNKKSGFSKGNAKRA